MPSKASVASGPPTNILVLYGTTEGQTRKIARFVADRLTARGHEAKLVDAAEAEAELDPRAFGAAVIAASLHTGHYQSAVVDFVRRHHDALDVMPTAFVSVSLSAASHDADDLDGLTRRVTEFEHRTQWTPREIHHAAGAFRFSQYDFLKRWALKYIAYRKGQPIDTSRDYELTGWDALGAFVDGFAAKLTVEWRLGCRADRSRGRSARAPARAHRWLASFPPRSSSGLPPRPLRRAWCSSRSPGLWLFAAWRPGAGGWRGRDPS